MTIAQLVLALVGVFWGVDFSAVVAVIGILAVVLSHPELLRLVKHQWTYCFHSCHMLAVSFGWSFW